MLQWNCPWCWGHSGVCSIWIWYDEAQNRYWTYWDQNHAPVTRWWRCGVHPRLSYLPVQNGRTIKRVDFGADWTMMSKLKQLFHSWASNDVSDLHLNSWQLCPHVWYNTGHFLLPAGGATTIPECSRLSVFRMRRQSYTSVLDQIKPVRTQLQPSSLSWRDLKWHQTSLHHYGNALWWKAFISHVLDKN